MMVAEDVLGAIERILPRIRDAAATTERDRAVSAEIIAFIAETGVFRILQPKRYGGMEGSIRLFFDAIAAIGGACASTGWVCGVLGTHQWVIANFPEQAQDDVWGKTPGTLLSGTAAPGSVKAVAVAGGYRVTGTWRFCSGSNHAAWHFGGATIVDPAPGTPDKAFFLLPIEDITLVDNWIVNGLCGTASCDGIADEVFVPEHRVLSIADMIAGITPGQQINSAPLYRLPNATVVALGIAAPPVGATGAALKAFIADTQTRERTGGLMGDSRKLWESPTLQLRVAESSAMLDAARALIDRDLEETERANDAGELTVDTRVRVRRDLSFGVRTCVEIMAMLYRSAGTEVMFPPNPLERTWRDVNAAAKHVGLNWDNLGTAAGRHLFGLDPRAQY
jgi:alkylation response protein AidB-like acyl-CoA dehydrogenase